MHSIMKKLLFKMAMLGQFLHIPRNLEIFDGRLGPGLEGDVTAVLFKDFRYWSEIWSDVQYHEADCYLKWPCLANFSVFHGTLNFSMTGLDHVWAHIRKCEEILLWHEIWWLDLMYHEANHYLNGHA